MIDYVFALSPSLGYRLPEGRDLHVLLPLQCLVHDQHVILHSGLLFLTLKPLLFTSSMWSGSFLKKRMKAT